jgi:hypothetical protein
MERYQITVLGFALLSLPMAAPGQFTYTNTGGAITITSGPGGAVVIPSTIDGLPVTGIGYAAFSNSRTLTSVTIPDTVLTIGDWAFHYCDYLVSVRMGSNVTSIGAYAFDYCPYMSSLNIPANLASIGEQAFDNCYQLTSITLPNSVTNIGSGAFYYCSGLTNVVIGNGVTSLPDIIFEECFKLTSVTLPQSTVNIGAWAFYSCPALSSITLPNSVTNIGYWAFYGCASLTNVTIPENVTGIGDLAFSACSSLAAIDVAPSNAQYSSVDGVLFDKSESTLIAHPMAKTGLYSIPGSVTTIGDFAFSSSSNLTGVIIPDGLANLSSGAFDGCSSLSSVRIPNTVTNIGANAFNGCISLTNLAIGNGVTSIGVTAFEGCSALASVFFSGNAPFAAIDYRTNKNGFVLELFVFSYDSSASVYYLPGATGWTNTFGGVPAVLWNPTLQPPALVDTQFTFDITGTTNIPIVLEATPDVRGGSWVSLLSGTLTNGLLHFTDPSWTNYANRFYRIRSP